MYAPGFLFNNYWLVLINILREKKNSFMHKKTSNAIFKNGSLKPTLAEKVRKLTTYIILDVYPSARPPIGGYPLGQAMNMGKLIRFWFFIIS